MPSTYNGIGTHYYGKSNVTRRPGPCPHCGGNVELTSYDTRLWFVVFFIPIIPLARKRIIDQCKACTRHYAVDIQKWETARQLEVSGAQDEYRKNPSPESAIALHQRLLNFHQHQHAAELQKEMAEKFATAIRKVAEGILSGTISSGLINQTYGDAVTIEQYRSALKELLEALPSNYQNKVGVEKPLKSRSPCG